MSLFLLCADGAVERVSHGASIVRALRSLLCLNISLWCVDWSLLCVNVSFVCSWCGRASKRQSKHFSGTSKIFCVEKGTIIGFFCVSVSHCVLMVLSSEQATEQALARH